MADIGRHGGHDAAAIAGVHPFLRPVDVYRKHVEGWEQADSERLEEGRVFERSILELYRLRTGAELLGGGLVVHPRIPWAVASLDERARRDGCERVVDAKHPNIYAGQEWAEGPPEYVEVQMQWYLGVTGLTLADVAAYLGGGKFFIHTVMADPELFGMLMEAVARFRRDYIEARVPPPPDGSESCADWLKARYPTSTGRLLPATDEASRLTAELRGVRNRLTALEENERELRNRLVSMCGDADGIDGLFTYRSAKGRASTDWQAVCAEAGVPAALVEKHSKRTPYRVFKLKNGGSND